MFVALFLIVIIVNKSAETKYMVFLAQSLIREHQDRQDDRRIVRQKMLENGMTPKYTTG